MKDLQHGTSVLVTICPGGLARLALFGTFGTVLVLWILILLTPALVVMGELAHFSSQSR